MVQTAHKQDSYFAPLVEHTDCRVGLKNLADQTVSLVLTDPPYFIDGMDDSWNKARLSQRMKHTGAVGGLPVGMKFDVGQGKRLSSFLRPVAQQWVRVLKPGGFALCFSQPRLIHHTAMAMEEAGFEIRDIIAWCYEGQAKAFSQDHFVRRRRDLSTAERNRIIKELGGRKTPQLKPQMELIVLGQTPRQGTFVDNWLKYRTGLIDISTPLVGSGFPGTVVKVSKPKRKDRYGHMTAKPVSLLRHLIRIFCHKGQGNLILDSFAGCGSCGEAAIMENCGFLGFEIDKDYAQKANERIQTTTRALV